MKLTIILLSVILTSCGMDFKHKLDGKAEMVGRIDGETKHTMDGEANVNVDGEADLTVSGETNMNVNGEANVNLDGEANVNLDGEANVTVDGNAGLTVSGEAKLTFDSGLSEDWELCKEVYTDEEEQRACFTAVLNRLNPTISVDMSNLDRFCNDNYNGDTECVDKLIQLFNFQSKGK